MRLEVNGILLTGEAGLDTGIDDLCILDTPGGPVLVSISRSDGGLATWDIGTSGLAQSADQQLISMSIPAGGGAGLLGMETLGEVWVAGTTGLTGYDISGTGQIGPSRSISGEGSGNLPVLASNGDEIVLASPQGNGFTEADITGTGNATGASTISDTGASHADGVSALGLSTVDGTTFAISASSTEMGISVWDLSGAGATLTATHGPAQGLGIMVPTDLSVVDLNGETFVVVASAGGASGALSVFNLDASGQLTPTDHVLDTLNTRFGQVQALEGISVDGRTFLVAAGGDLGLALLELLPDGRLLHHHSIADTDASSLFGVTNIALTVVGDTLQVFAASQAEAGITQLTIDLPGSQDDVIMGTGAGEVLSGGAGDDIFIDGDSTDTLRGEDGADIFVMSNDALPDRIDGFDPTEDILDLSDWSFLYDVNDLTIQTVFNGTRISWGEATVFLTGVGGAELDADAVRDAIVIPLNRQFWAPTESLVGTSGDDTLTGNWGEDEITGAGGNDLLEGLEGDDQLDGEAGNDTLHGDGGDDTLTGGGGGDALFGGSGDDILEGEDDADSLFGGSDQDTLFGGDGGDTLVGGFGNDEVYGDGGDDTLEGGAGADTLYGGAGSDLAVVGVSSASVTVISGTGTAVSIASILGADTFEGIELFDFTDGILTLQDVLDLESSGSGGGDTGGGDTGGGDTGGGDTGGGDTGGGDTGGGGDPPPPPPTGVTLTGTNGADTLTGSDYDDLVLGNEGDDLIFGNDGNDILYGDDGYDDIRAGPGDDIIFGGDGRGRLVGNNGDDIMYGGPDRDRMIGGSGQDLMKGGGSRDRISGNKNADRLEGGTGDDIIRGNRGADLLLGGGDNDILYGGGENDRLNGERGNDTLEGGNGQDEFVFAVQGDRDVILDFTVGDDWLLLTNDLWEGHASATDLLAEHGSISSGDLILDFGSGDVLTVRNISTFSEIEDWIGLA